jgi:hypothetical protein
MFPNNLITGDNRMRDGVLDEPLGAEAVKKFREEVNRGS